MATEDCFQIVLGDTACERASSVGADGADEYRKRNLDLSSDAECLFT